MCRACVRPWPSVLVAAGQDAQAVAAIVAPAGHPIGAHTPEEVALSVLVAVVAARRQGAVLPTVSVQPAPTVTPPIALPEIASVAAPRSCCGG